MREGGEGGIKGERGRGGRGEGRVKEENEEEAYIYT
jgi:hypothetical protein